VHRWDSPLERHRFGFVQPTADAPVVPLDEIGIVLVPGLVFDRAGGRIGYGKGYYDSLLAATGGGTRLVGITYDELVVERLPTTSRDVAMTHLATEGGLRPVPLTGP
jgi:5-formyltetrahydrofolate cyclo-ligase